MPTYDYECQACSHRFERWQEMSARKLRTCPECGKRQLVRLVGAGAGVIFRGSGFYETDYKRKQQSPAKAGGSSTSASDGKGDGAASSSSSSASGSGSGSSGSSGSSSSSSKTPASGGSGAKGDSKAS